MSAPTDTEMWCPSVDVCAFCGDVYCDGIACIAALDPNDPDDIPDVERLQGWLRRGRLSEQVDSYLAERENRR